MPIVGFLSNSLGAATPGYTGPGDVVPGAAAFWGTRAYTGGRLGIKAIRLRRDSDQAEQDFNVIAGGGLDISGITTFKSTANLFVTKLYDQIGTADFAQATAANQPGFQLSGLGSLPIMNFLQASAQNMTNSSGALAQPFTICSVNLCSGGSASQNEIWEAGAPNSQVQYHNSGVNNVILFAGTVITSTVSDNAWHAIYAVFNGASSNMRVDGTDNVAAGGSGAGSNEKYGGTNQNFTGSSTEIFRYNSALSSTNLGLLRTNQSAYYGTP